MTRSFFLATVSALGLGMVLAGGAYAQEADESASDVTKQSDNGSQGAQDAGINQNSGTASANNGSQSGDGGNTGGDAVGNDQDNDHLDMDNSGNTADSGNLSLTKTLTINEDDNSDDDGLDMDNSGNTADSGNLSLTKTLTVNEDDNSDDDGLDMDNSGNTADSGNLSLTKTLTINEDDNSDDDGLDFDNSLNNSFNDMSDDDGFDMDITTGDIMLSNTSLSTSVSGISLSAALPSSDEECCAMGGAIYTGNVNSNTTSGINGLVQQHYNTGFANQNSVINVNATINNAFGG